MVNMAKKEESRIPAGDSPKSTAAPSSAPTSTSTHVSTFFDHPAQEAVSFDYLDFLSDSVVELEQQNPAPGTYDVQVERVSSVSGASKAAEWGASINDLELRVRKTCANGVSEVQKALSVTYQEASASKLLSSFTQVGNTTPTKKYTDDLTTTDEEMETFSTSSNDIDSPPRRDDFDFDSYRPGNFNGTEEEANNALYKALLEKIPFAAVQENLSGKLIGWSKKDGSSKKDEKKKVEDEKEPEEEDDIEVLNILDIIIFE